MSPVSQITSLSPNFSASWLSWVKSLVVVPQRDAVFSTSTTFPFSSENLN